MLSKARLKIYRKIKGWPEKLNFGASKPGVGGQGPLDLLVEVVVRYTSMYKSQKSHCCLNATSTASLQPSGVSIMLVVTYCAWYAICYFLITIVYKERYLSNLFMRCTSVPDVPF